VAEVAVEGDEVAVGDESRRGDPDVVGGNGSTCSSETGKQLTVSACDVDAEDVDEGLVEERRQGLVVVWLAGSQGEPCMKIAEDDGRDINEGRACENVDGTASLPVRSREEADVSITTRARLVTATDRPRSFSGPREPRRTPLGRSDSR